MERACLEGRARCCIWLENMESKMHMNLSFLFVQFGVASCCDTSTSYMIHCFGLTWPQKYIMVDSGLTMRPLPLTWRVWHQLKSCRRSKSNIGKWALYIGLKLNGQGLNISQCIHAMNLPIQSVEIQLLVTGLVVQDPPIKFGLEADESHSAP